MHELLVVHDNMTLVSLIVGSNLSSEWFLRGVTFIDVRLTLGYINVNFIYGSGSVCWHADFMLVVGCHHVYNESGDSICGLDSEIYEHISSVP